MSDETNLDDEIENILSGEESESVEEPEVETHEPLMTADDPVPVMKLTGENRAFKDRQRIIIHDGDETESRDVFVSVNGRAFQIQRGVEVDVPLEVIEVLNNAKKARLIQKPGGENVFREVPRFSYTVVPMQ